VCKDADVGTRARKSSRRSVARVLTASQTAGLPAGLTVIARNEDMYCEQNVNNACYESKAKLYREIISGGSEY